MRRNALRTLNRGFGLMAREAEYLKVVDVTVAGVAILVIKLGALPPTARPRRSKAVKSATLEAASSSS